MDPLLLLKTSTVLLALGALVGVGMAWMRFAGRPYPPPSLSMLHGLLVAAALTLLVYGAATVGLPPLALGALALFLVAAGGGAALNLGYHWKQQALPRWLVSVHAVAAVVGFALLVLATWPQLGGSQLGG
jgi:hypothetical protein